MLVATKVIWDFDNSDKIREDMDLIWKRKVITQKTRYEFSLGKKDENCVGCNVITKQHITTGITQQVCEYKISQWKFSQITNHSRCIGIYSEEKNNVC